MKLKEIQDKLNLEVVVADGLEKEVSSGYTCDLLSEVMGKAKKDSIWTTIQTHMNIVAVATLVGIRAIIIANSKTISEDTIQKAKEENLVLFKTSLNQFEVSGKLYELGIR